MTALVLPFTQGGKRDRWSRLRLATQRLEKEVEAQRQSVTKYLDSLEKLNAVFGKLDDSTRLYQRKLGGINIKRLGGRARRLAAIMERAEKSR